jgi:hypothetical protein
VVAFAVLFRRRPPVRVAYLVGTTGLVAFAFLIYVGHLRHHGHHLLLLLACLWIWFCAPDQKVRRLPRAASLLIAGLLAANLVAGLYAVARDARDPFSAGRAVARFIRSNAPGDVTVVGHRDVQVATVTGYLQRPVYYPSMGREAIFVGHGSTSGTAIDDEETMRQARARAEQQGRDVIVVLSRSGRRRPKSLAGAAKVGDFSVSIVASERYEVYRMPAAAGRNLRGP